MKILAAIQDKINNIFRRKDKDAPIILDICLEKDLYEKLKNNARLNSISESEELSAALKRGMRDYWLHVIKHDRERYAVIARLFEQSQRDSILLEQIVKQNEDYRMILQENSCQALNKEQAK